jgi:hypothetical protein
VQQEHDERRRRRSYGCNDGSRRCRKKMMKISIS